MSEPLSQPTGRAQEAIGQHLLIECAGPLAHADEEALERLLRAAAQAAGATVLGAHLHAFGPGQGVTGVLLLAESHITVHTWPERGYAAFDVFMCGQLQPWRAARVIRAACQDGRVDVRAIARGAPAAIPGD